MFRAIQPLEKNVILYNFFKYSYSMNVKKYFQISSWELYFEGQNWQPLKLARCCIFPCTDAATYKAVD